MPPAPAPAAAARLAAAAGAAVADAMTSPSAERVARRAQHWQQAARRCERDGPLTDGGVEQPVRAHTPPTLPAGRLDHYFTFYFGQEGDATRHTYIADSPGLLGAYVPPLYVRHPSPIKGGRPPPLAATRGRRAWRLAPRLLPLIRMHTYWYVVFRTYVPTSRYP